MPFVQRLIVSPAEPVNTVNIFDTETNDISIDINGITRKVLYINGFPSEPLSININGVLQGKCYLLMAFRVNLCVVNLSLSFRFLQVL